MCLQLLLIRNATTFASGGVQYTHIIVQFTARYTGSTLFG